MANNEPVTPTGVREGEILAGKYRVERVLGAGGMGVVVAAHHLHLDERVAIKFLLPEMLASAELVARFGREARAAAKIRSEHVARVFDVGVLETGAPYMVMEFLQGADLASWMRERGPLPIDQAIDFVLQASVGVAEAHSLRIVHRDLKPANLFCVLGSDGRPIIKVLDFGISKMTGPSSAGTPAGPTRTNAMLGSPLYMSPEQMRSSKDVDARSDLWSLGVVLYELLTGRVPFTGETVADLAVNVATRTPEPIRAFRPEVEDGLEAVVGRCLERDRERRYRNVAELALALLPHAPPSSKPAVAKITGIIEAAGLSTTALAMPPSPRQAEPMTTQTAMGATAPRAGGARALLWLGTLGGCGLALAAGGIWTMSRAVRGARAGEAAPETHVEASGAAQAAVFPPGATGGAARLGEASDNATVASESKLAPLASSTREAQKVASDADAGYPSKPLLHAATAGPGIRVAAPPAAAPASAARSSASPAPDPLRALQLQQ